LHVALDMSPTELRGEGQLGRMRWAVLFLVALVALLIAVVAWFIAVVDLSFPGM
jgi:hypothetical protein